MTYDAEHLFIHLSAISSLVSACSDLCSFFLIGYFLLLNFKNSLYILDTSLYSGNVIHRYFLPVFDLAFHSLDSVFLRAEIFNVNEVQRIRFFFFYHGSCFWCCIKNSLPNPSSPRLPTVFSSEFSFYNFAFYT